MTATAACACHVRKRFLCCFGVWTVARHCGRSSCPWCDNVKTPNVEYETNLVNENDRFQQQERSRRCHVEQQKFRRRQDVVWPVPCCDGESKDDEREQDPSKGLELLMRHVLEHEFRRHFNKENRAQMQARSRHVEPNVCVGETHGQAARNQRHKRQ